MQISPFSRRTLPVLLTGLLIAVSFCYADQKTVQVIGVSECADCQKNNIKHSDAFKGLRVTIDCKLANGEMKTRGEGKLDEEGKFQIEFPHELVENGKKLKEECYAQLHGASNLPCPTYSGIESSKLAFVSESDGKHTFSPAGKIKISPETCTSEFLWPYFKYPFHKKWPFTIPKIPFKKPGYKKPYYTTPTYKKPHPHYYPKYKKPLPTVPIYKKPLPPIVPVYKKPLPPIVPIYKKPLPPIVPIYKKPYPTIYKKPCPPITIPKFDIPKFPPKVYYEHPKFKKWPFFPPKP